MDHEFWHQRWRENQIGFHQETVNPHLLAHWDRLGIAEDATVFVPLCGKSLDMVWLAERYRVLGVELSPRAVEDFYSEQGLTPERRTEWPFVVYEGEGVTLMCGDFFALEPAHTADIAAIYDRAALIALPPHMRVDYAARLTELAPGGIVMLLVTLEYDPSQMNGPPFPVEPEEVESLYGAGWRIESLQQDDILDSEPRFRARGLTRFSEHLYRLTRNAD